ncbi:MAG: sodium-dependent bicarbonate transport family permease, partial [Verrucomicrobiota bacterium]
GSLAIGAISGEEGWAMLKPVVYDPFKGLLCLFLLDMGLIAAKRIRDLRQSGATLVLFAVGAALVNGFIGIFLARLLNLSPGDALLLAILVGSASYIAVPAAVRLAIPEANPSLYVPMALCVTFPFNVVLGIPLHYAVIQAVWRIS